MYFCIESNSMTQGEMSRLLKCFNPTKLVYITEHSKAVVLVLLLLCGAWWFILQGDLY